MNTLQKIGLGTLAVAGAVGVVLVSQPKPVVHSAHWHVVDPGSYWNYPCPAGDTLDLQKGIYGYMSFGTESGNDSLHPNVIVCEPGVTFSKGLSWTDCHYWKLDGQNNLYINNHQTTTAITVQGKSSDFEFCRFVIDSCLYGWWFKQDAFSYPNDSSYWFGKYFIHNIFIHDVKAMHGNQDCGYEGSTDEPPKIFASYYGKSRTERPMGLMHIRNYKDTVIDFRRSGIQMSGCWDCVVDQCVFKNFGDPSQGYNQGAGIRAGYNDSDITITNNYVDSTMIYNSDCYAKGKIVYRNNTFNHAGVCSRGVNSQGIPNVNIVAFFFPTTIRLINNNIGLNSAKPSTNIALYGSAAFYTASGNKINNSGAWYNLTGGKMAIDTSK